MIWGIVALILLIVIIGLVIWLLIRQSNLCPAKSSLGGSCSTNIDCNGGLVCNNSICKVASGGICTVSSDCSTNQSCVAGICTTTLNGLNAACPCGNGFTCVNNVCKAIVGQACTNNSDCSTNVCLSGVCVVRGTTGMTGDSCEVFDSCWDNTSSYNNSSNSCNTNSKYSSRSGSSNSYNTSKYSNSRSSNSDHTKDYSQDHSQDYSQDSYKKKYTEDHSQDYSKDYSQSYDNLSSWKDESNESSEKYDKKHKRRVSDSSVTKCKKDKWDSNWSEKDYHRRRNTDHHILTENSHYSSDSRYDENIRRGVYVTNQNNQDSQLFTGIDQPIIDIARNTNAANFVLLLEDGNLAISNNTTTNIWVTNKRMRRIIRFGNQIIGLDKDGRLYSRLLLNGSNGSNNNMWNWERLNNYPSDVIFMSNTNAPYNNLEVLTCKGKAYVYAFSNSWKDGNAVHIYKTHKFRYFGKDLSRYIDINEETNTGITNDKEKYRHIKGAGFYTNNTIIPVLTEDTFTHVRIIDNNAYFLFQQEKC